MEEATNPFGRLQPTTSKKKEETTKTTTAKQQNPTGCSLQTYTKENKTNTSRKKLKSLTQDSNQQPVKRKKKQQKQQQQNTTPNIK
jgi:hypothetical protein